MPGDRPEEVDVARVAVWVFVIVFSLIMLCAGFWVCARIVRAA